MMTQGHVQIRNGARLCKGGNDRTRHKKMAHTVRMVHALIPMPSAYYLADARNRSMTGAQEGSRSRLAVA